MAIKDTDLLYVQRPEGADAGSYKIEYSDLIPPSPPEKTLCDFKYTYPDGVERGVCDRLGEYVSVKDFGAKGDGVIDDTAAIQAAVDAAETRGTLFANKSGVGGIVFIPSGTYLISDKIHVKGNGVVIQGEGPSASCIRLMDETKNGFHFAGPDPFNTGNADPIGARPIGQGIRDLRMILRGGDQTDARDNTMVLVERSLFFADNLYLQGYRQGIQLLGVPEGTKVTNISMSSAAGPALTGVQVDSSHIRVGLCEVDSADALAKDGGDGKFYDRSVGVYLSNIQTKDPAGQWPVNQGLVINSVDGCYVSNCHFGFASGAQVLFSTILEIGILNVLLTNLFLDSSNDTLEPSNYAIRFVNPSGSDDVSVNNVVINNIRANVSKFGAFAFDHKGLTGCTLTNFTVNQNFDPQPLIGAIDIFKGDHINISNGIINGTKDGFYIKVAGGQHINISNIIGHDETGLRGDAKEGVRIQQTNIDNPTEYVKFTNIDVANWTDEGFSVNMPTGSVTMHFSDLFSGDNNPIPVASPLSVPPDKDSCVISGTGTINAIKSNSSGNSTWIGRKLTLKFEDVVTVTTNVADNMANNFVSQAGSVLQLECINGTWTEISRSV